MTEPSPALTSIRPVPPSLIFVMRLLHSLILTAICWKGCQWYLIVVLVSAICSHVRLEVVTFGSYWSTFAIIPCSIYTLHTQPGSLFGLSHNLAMYCTATSRPHPAPAEYRWPSAMTCFLVLVKSTWSMNEWILTSPNNRPVSKLNIEQIGN